MMLKEGFRADHSLRTTLLLSTVSLPPWISFSLAVPILWGRADMLSLEHPPHLECWWSSNVGVCALILLRG